MGNFVRVLKVNIYSIIALPFLLLATFSKLVAKALSRIKTIFTMLMITGIVLLIILVMREPGKILDFIKSGLGITVGLGVVLIILRFAFSVVSFVLTSLYHLMVGLFDTIYMLAFDVYQRLEQGCSNDFEYLRLTGPSFLYMVLCSFYLVLRLVNFLIKTFINLSLVAFIIASVGFAGYLYINTASSIQNTFGISFGEYFSLFDTVSKIQSIILYVVLVADVFVVLVSLGIEWKEWSDELTLGDADYDKYAKAFEDYDDCMENIEAEDNEGYEYFLTVDEHLGAINDFLEEVRYAIDLGDNPLLENACNEYLRNLSEISDEISARNGKISSDELTRMKPYIRQLDKQKDKINKMLEKQNEILDNPAKNSIFFSGCTTRNKLDKRYKSLCKAYHPDTEGGDSETFMVLTEEYNRLKDMMDMADANNAE